MKEDAGTIDNHSEPMLSNRVFFNQNNMLHIIAQAAKKPIIPVTWINCALHHYLHHDKTRKNIAA
ncbi:MAG: hypothetical protein Q8Q81_18380 [Oxalobacteraceae bacterium]|nr:hypothetical protein [Oxalobacteraceae bacterium]